MRFLADGSCDFRVVRALRAAGYDVAALVEIAPGAEDQTVIDFAVREDRIVVTEDRDFGQLVYAAAKPAAGVILIRFPSTGRGGLPRMLVDFLAEYRGKIADRFIVLQPGRIHFGLLPRD